MPRQINHENKEKVRLLIEENPNISNKDISKRLNISQTTIKRYRELLGSSRPLKSDQQKEDIKLLIENNPNITNKEISERLNIDATIVGRHRKAIGLPITSNKENTIENIKLLIEKNPNITTKDIAKRLNIHLRIVNKHRKELGLSNPVSRDIGKKQREDIKLLIEQNPSITNKEISDELNINKLVVSRQREQLGLPSLWRDDLATRKEHELNAIQQILEENPGMTTPDLADHLGIPQERVKQRRKELNLNIQSATDISIERQNAILDLADAYPNLTSREVSDLLNIPVPKAYQYLRQLDLISKTKEISDNENNQVIRDLVNNTPDISAIEISKIMGIDILEVENHLKALAIGKKYDQIEYEENKLAIQKLLEENPGITLSEINNQLGINKISASQIRKEFGYGHKDFRVISKEQLEAIGNLLEENPNMSSKDIAELLDVDKTHVNRLRQRLGISAPSTKSISDLNKDNIRYLITENPDITTKEIAEQLGMDIRNVNKYRKSIGLPSKHSNASAKERPAIIKELINYNPTITAEEVASILSIHKATAKKHMDKIKEQQLGHTDELRLNRELPKADTFIHSTPQAIIPPSVITPSFGGKRKAKPPGFMPRMPGQNRRR